MLTNTDERSFYEQRRDMKSSTPLIIAAALLSLAFASVLASTAHEHYRLQSQGTGPVRAVGKDAEAVSHGHTVGYALGAALAASAGVGLLAAAGAR